MANEFKGLSKDTKSNKTPTGMWEFARNILLTKGFLSVTNEEGFKYKHSVPGTILGIISSNDEIVYLSLDGDYSCIGYINTNVDDTTYNLVLRTNNKDFRFNINCPIEGIYIYNYKKEMIISFCDGVKKEANVPKLINIHNPQIELDNNGELVYPSQITLLNLFPLTKEGIINISYNTQGILSANLIYITYAYVYNDNTDTPFYPIHKIAYLSTGIKPLEKRSINIELKELDVNFSKLRLGILVKDNNGLFAYKSNIFSYENNYLKTTVNSLTNYTSIAADELIITKTTFDRIQTITKRNNRAIVGHTVKEELKDFQKYANLLNLELYSIDNSDIINNTDIHNYPNFMPDEVYSITCSLQLLDGTYTRAFHIPGREATNDEKDLITLNDLQQLGLDPLITEEYKRFHLFNTGDFVDKAGINPLMNFGYWENLETYPNTDDYNSTLDYQNLPLTGKDLRGTPIRYHRFPGLDTMAKYFFEHCANDQDISEYIPKFGIKLTNFLDVIPDNIKNKIQGYKLSFVKRTRGDSLVETNGALVRSVTMPNEVDGIDYDTETTYISRAPGSKHSFMYDKYNIEFGKAKIYNIDLYKYKPIIDPTLLKANYAFKIKSIGLSANDPNLVGGLVNDEQRYAIFKDIKYLVENNITAKTRFTETTILIEAHNYKNEIENTWKPTNTRSTTPLGVIPANIIADLYSWDINSNSYILDEQGPFSSLAFGLNCTMLNIQKNLYTGFKSSNLVTIGRTTLNNSLKLFREGGDTFTNNKLDLTIQQNLICNTRVRLNIGGLRSVTNNTRLYTEEPPSEAGDTDDTLCPGRTDDLNVLNSLDYTVKVEGEEELSSINDIITSITYDINDEFIDYFPYRINRGLVTPNENLKTEGLRTFLSDDYYEVRNDRGPIIALRATHKKLFIQQQYSLFIAQIKDKLNSSGVETYLGESNLFDRLPDEILYNDNKGYIGSTSQFSCLIFKGGYVTIDQIQGKIFIINSKVNEISSYNMRNYFKDNWDIGIKFNETNRFNIKQRIDNPFVSVGHLVSFDDDYNRLIVTKKLFNFKFEDLLGTQYFFDGHIYRDRLGNKLDFYNTGLFDNLSITFSFDLKDNVWVCNHDYFPNAMYYCNTGLYSNISRLGQDSEVYKHNDPNTKGLYYGNKFESYVDIIFNKRLDLSKLYQNVNWVTEVKDNNTNTILYNETVDKVILYNNYQCSGVLDIKNGKFEIVRTLENKWQLNEFRDIVIDRSSPIITNEGLILENNLNNFKSWFEKSYFISNFIVVRLIIDNIDNKEKYIHNINVKSRISKR